MTLLPPLPAIGSAAVEILIPSELQDVWGGANWGTGVWEAHDWVDVTPQSMNVQVSWGAGNPMGVLSATEAGRFTVETYDPARLLDPSQNVNIHPGVQIRLRYLGADEVNVRRGVIDDASYSYSTKQGRITATDGVADLAVAIMPGTFIGEELVNQLDDRVADALERSQFDVSKPGGTASIPNSIPVGDPESEDSTVWFTITRAALDALHAIWVDADGVIRARNLAAVEDSGVDLGGATGIPLDDIEASTSMVGVYTRVIANDESIGEVMVVAPDQFPVYGDVPYRRDRPIPDALTWANNVLEDRSGDAAGRIALGTIRPRTEAEFLSLVELGMAHVVHVFVDSIFPPVALDVVVVGGAFEANTVTGWSARLVAYVLDWGIEVLDFLFTPGGDPLVTPAGDPLVV